MAHDGVHFCDRGVCGRKAAIALSMRGVILALLLNACVVVSCVKTRTVPLATLIITVWGYTICNMVALHQYHLEYGGPYESVYNVFTLVTIYIIFIPGMPLAGVCICGWGVVVIVVATHLALWVGSGADYAPVLWAELVKCSLFNLFGMLTAYEQISEMRFNYWHTKLLAEAMIVQKLVRNRMHGLLSNTLPAPVLKAIGRGDKTFVRTYPHVTVLQVTLKLLKLHGLHTEATEATEATQTAY